MSKKRLIQVAIVAGLAVFLWARALSREGAPEVLGYAIAGTLSGIALGWIVWSFATITFSRKTAVSSLLVGFFIFTPLIAMLLAPSRTPLDSSAVVLATTAGCVAAMAGAIWGVSHLAHDAFASWRNERKTTKPLSLGEAHR
jgi:Kef-type K+ transport system membrane component KefB